MRVLCIIQARMGSTRLPGKVMREIKGKPLIVHMLDRLKRCEKIDHIVLATTSLPEDRRLLELARREKVEGFAGSEEDVLDRYYQAALHHRPEIVVRCTGDCPVIDSEVTASIIQRHIDGGKDYTSNTLIRSYPRGLDTEAMKFQALEKAAREAKTAEEREHVTPYIYRHTKLFSIEPIVAEKERYDPDLRICVDTKEDLELISRLFEALYEENPFFSVDHILDFVRIHPELKKINSHIVQKQV